MNKSEAKAIIQNEVDQLRSKSYDDLRKMIDNGQITGERKGQSGAKYQIEIIAFWDDKIDCNIRVAGTIDESPHKPIFWKIPILNLLPIYISSVNYDFIKSPSQKFVGE